MRHLLLSLFVMCCSIRLAHAQIPVTDAAMNANTIANQITNAATWGNQLLKLKEQASTLKFVTDVSSAIRDAAYAKSLIERQSYIVDRCTDVIVRADKVDLSLASSIERNVTDFLATNNSLISLISNTMTSKFKMNDSERLKSLMDIKKEQDELLQRLHTVDMILGTSMATRDIIELQLLK